MTTLLVTGADGFIGRNVVRSALDRGFDVVTLARRDGRPADTTIDVERLSCDLRDRETLSTLLRGRSIDHVFNAAGSIVHANFGVGGDAVFASHFDGVRNLVDCLDRDALQSFVTLGSSDEYGDHEAPQTETMRERPISPYALAKTATAHFLQTLVRTEGLPAVILRLFLVYGPGQKRDRFLPFLIDGCLAKGRVGVSEGEQVRDFTYITDAVDAVFAAVACDAAHGEVINIGSGNGIRLREMMQLVLDKVGTGEFDFGVVPYRPGENMALVADVAKAERILGWRAVTSLSEGLDRTIDWYRSVTSS